MDSDSGGKGKNKGGRPPKDVTKTPEFQAAVEAGVAAALPAILEKLSAQISTMSAGPGVPTAGMDFAQLLRDLTMNLADVADQGTGRPVRLAPDEITRRKAAVEEMGRLLMEAYEQQAAAEGDGDERRMAQWTPEYELLDKIVVGERLVQPFQDVNGVAEPTVIEWNGAPGPVMRPVNKIAKLIFEQYAISIGGIADTVDAEDKREMWVTLGKLTVKTSRGARFRDAPRRQVSNFADSNNGSPIDREPRSRIKRPQDPRDKEVAILGTVAPKAKRELGPVMGPGGDRNR